MKSEFREDINVSDLILDLENPRFGHLKMQNAGDVTEADISALIEQDKETKTLLKSVKKSGIQDPIWIQAREDGKYTVIEGNRRTTVLRMLIRNNEDCDVEGYDFRIVKAHVIPSNASKQDVIIKKATLQTGKKEWGKFQESFLIHQLESEFYMEEEDIAARLGKSMAAIKKVLADYDEFMRYQSTTGDNNPKKFSYFQEAPPKVKQWISESSKNREIYYSLISPINGTQKIRSIATKNGLRDFSRYILDDDEAFQALVTDESVEMEEAMQIAKENDIEKELGWVGKLELYAQRIRSLDESQIIKIRQQSTLRRAVTQLSRAVQQLEQDIQN